MIRSGSTVLYQIASAVVELRGIGKRCGYYEPPHDPPVPSPQSPAPGQWSVYKVPWLCHREKELLRDGSAIALYSYRDIEDALDSAYRAFQVPDGDRWLHRALTEAHVNEIDRLVRQDAPDSLHPIPFADIRDELRNVVSKVDFWIPGPKLDHVEIDAIAADLALERQKARPKIHPYDPHTLLCANHFSEPESSTAI
jgi:hypothetical protein